MYTTPLDSFAIFLFTQEELIGDYPRPVDEAPTDTRVLINLAATKIFRMERFFQQLQL